MNRDNAREPALRRFAVAPLYGLSIGATVAVLFSLISTYQRHQVDLFGYLRDVLARIAAQPTIRPIDLAAERWEPGAPAPSAQPPDSRAGTTVRGRPLAAAPTGVAC